MPEREPDVRRRVAPDLCNDASQISMRSANGARVGIGMPVFNDASYIETAIKSILAQTYVDFELLISDNASTDQTATICLLLASLDRRIRYVRQPKNIGMVANFNFVKRASEGMFFMWAAGDDVWAPEFLEIAVNALDKESEAVGAFPPYSFMDSDGRAFGGTRRVEYRDVRAVTRLERLLDVYDDGVFYALWRRNVLQDVDVPLWWSVNRWTPLNCAYPVLCAALVSGSIVTMGRHPLWFNRITSESSHFPSMSNRWVRVLRVIVHKFNVLCSCELYVFRASRSLLLTIGVGRALVRRFFLEIVSPLRLFVGRRRGRWVNG